MSDLKKTNKSFTIKTDIAAHYNGREYKPWFMENDPEISDGIVNINGYNSGDPTDSVLDLLEQATEDGRIVRQDKNGNPQNYLMEFKVEVTKLEWIKENDNECKAL